MYKSYLAEDKPVNIPAGSEHPPTKFRSSIRENGTQDERSEVKRNKSAIVNELPKSIYQPTTDRKAGRYVETDSTGVGNQMRKIRGRLVKQRTPGWLIALEPEILRIINGLKKALQTLRDPCELVDTLAQIINGDLQIEVSHEEITEVLMAVPYDVDKGPSFSHFMFFMGNFEEAANMFRKVFWESGPKAMGCGQYKKPGEEAPPPICGSEKAPPTKKKTAATYSRREKFFYSGLLIFEMNDTLQGIEKLYFGSWVPEVPTLEQKCNIDDFNPDAIGFGRKGMAAWDRPLPPLPKISPYATPMPFVTTRLKIMKPDGEDRGRRGTVTTIQPLHMMIEPPRKANQPIRITENRKRIRQTLLYLSAHGDCVTLLPDIHLTIHLSDTFIEKLEEITTMPVKPGQKTGPLPKINYSADLAWISREAKTLYRPHGIPEQISKLKPLIKYTDGLNLRTICEHIRTQHWAYMSNRKLEFREGAWGKMHAERIPPGKLRDSFVYAFVTYLPYLSHLPILHDQNSNPY